MKKSLKSKYQVLLLIFFAIFILESALILLTVFNPIGLNQLKADIQSIVILFMLFQFIYFVVLFYYVPYQYEHSLKEIYQVIHEISEGKYQIDIDLKTHHQSEEIRNLMLALRRMMSIIIKFDNLKTDKIYEHHQRIQMLINMIPQGCLIITITGEIVYCNSYIKEQFPALYENLNILETLLPEYIEVELKPLMIESIKTGNNLHDRTIKIDALKTTYVLNNSIIRNRKGQSIGAIFIIEKEKELCPIN
jgi:signal transduction histidine kinase